MAKAVDKNQPAIVAALREAGATVVHLHEVGRGCPDLLVGWHGVNYLLEVKNPARGALTANQRSWFRAWQGRVFVVCTIKEALRAIGFES